MKRIATIVGGLVLIVVVAGAAFALSRRTNSNDNTVTTQTVTSAAQTRASTQASNDVVAATISYDGSSFNPSKVTVTSGAKVVIKNDSSKLVQFDSDPHPAHTDDTELNAGSISPGKSVTITVDKVGTWGYHNHLDERQTGMIIVQ